MIVRCSSLDRILACAGSLEETATPYSPNNPEAREGTAAHEVLACIPHGVEPDFDQTATRHGVDADGLQQVYRRARVAWAEVERWFGPEREADSERLSAEIGEGVELRGTPDLLAVERELAAVAPGSVGVLDWKTGWSPQVHPHQLRGYAFLARARYGMPASGYILGVEVWARVGEYRIHKFSAESLDGLAVDVLEQARRRGRQYGPSYDACAYCPLQTSCVARAEWVRSGVTALVPIAENRPITRGLVGELYERRRQLGKALAQYDEVLRAMLAEGPVSLPDGRKLELTDKEQDHLVPSKALPFLRGELQLAPHEIDQVLRMSKGGLEDVLKSRVVKGEGARAMRAAMERLRELEAVEKITSQTVKVVA